MNHKINQQQVSNFISISHRRWKHKSEQSTMEVEEDNDERN